MNPEPGKRRRRSRRRRGTGSTREPSGRAGESQAMDEVFEELWMYEETHEGMTTPHAELVNRIDDPDPDALLKRMAEQGLLRREKDVWHMEEKGRERAREVIRRHRLAERWPSRSALCSGTPRPVRTATPSHRARAANASARTPALS
jgi:hypothetical protein